MNLNQSITILDLIKYSTVKSPKKWKGSKRLRAKFIKTWTKKVPKSIRNCYLGIQLSKPISTRLLYSSIFREACIVEPM